MGDEVWEDLLASRRERLNELAVPYFESPGSARAASQAVDALQGLIAEYRTDDWVPTRVLVGRLGQRTAALLSGLGEDDEALATLQGIEDEYAAHPEGDLREVGADACLDRARLYWALGQHAEAFACARSLIERLAPEEHEGLGHTHALAQESLVRWTLESTGVDDGIAGQQRVIAACEELVRDHRTASRPAVLFSVLWVMHRQVDALREQASFLRADDPENEEDADALDVRVLVLGDDAWDWFAETEDPQVQASLAHLMLNTRDEADADERRAAAERVLARFGDSEEPVVAPELTWALSVRAAGQRRSGDLVGAQRTLKGLLERFSGSAQSRVQNSRLWAVAELGSMLRSEGRGDEAVGMLQQTLTWLDLPGLAEDAAVRLRVAQALDLAADIQADAAEEGTPDGSHDGVGVTLQDGPTVEVVPVSPEMAAYADAIDLLVSRFADDPYPAVRRLTVGSLYDLAVRQRQLLHVDEATASYQRLIGLFAEDVDGEVQQTVARSSLNLGWILMVLLSRYSEALDVYDEALKRHDSAATPGMRDTLAKITSSRVACLNSLMSLGETPSYGDYEDLPRQQIDALAAIKDESIAASDAGDHRKAIEGYDRILIHVESLHPELRRRCLDASVRKAYSLAQLGHREEAFAVNTEAVTRYASDLSMEMQKDVSLALANAARNLDILGRHEEEIGAYDQMIEQFSGSTVTPIASRVSYARFARAVTLADLGRVEEAIDGYQDSMRHSLSRPVLDQRYHGAASGVRLAYLYKRTGRGDEAVRAAQQVIDACSGLTEPRMRKEAARARLALARTYAETGHKDRAIAEFTAVVGLPQDDIDDTLRGKARDELFALRPSAGLSSLASGFRRWMGRGKA